MEIPSFLLTFSFCSKGVFVRSPHPTPAKMSQEGARPLSRLAFACLLAVFIGNIFFIQDFWSLDEATYWGLAQDILSEGIGHAFMPTLWGEPFVENGPLNQILVAILLWIFPSDWQFVAIRTSTLLWFAIAVISVWFTTFHLARRNEAQPIRLPFGDEAQPLDYARVVADSAVLLLISTFSVTRGVYTADLGIPLLACSCLSLYGISLSLYHPKRGAFIAGVAAALATLTTSLFAGAWLLASVLLTNWFVRAFHQQRKARIRWSISAYACIVLTWIILAYLIDPDRASNWFAQWHQYQIDLFGIINHDVFTWFGKNFIWFLCPLWPIVLVGLYNWRHHLKESHIAIPLFMWATSVIAGLFSKWLTVTTVFTVWIPALSVLASFSLFTIKKTRVNILDWFSVSVFSLASLSIWLYWAAWATHFAPKMEHSIVRLAPNATPELGLGFVIAVIASAIWTSFVLWRVTHRPSVMWRGPWLAASGITVTSVIFMGLFHPALQENRSYASVAKAIRQEVIPHWQPTDCITVSAMPAGTKFSLQYHMTLPLNLAPKAQCTFTIHRLRRSASLEASSIKRPHTDEFFIVEHHRQ